MKKKNWLYVIWLSTIAVITTIIYCLYPSVSNHVAYPQVMADKLMVRLMSVIPDLGQQTGSNIQPTQYIDYNDYDLQLLNDENFYYYATNSQTKLTVSSRNAVAPKDLNPEDYHLILHFSIDDQGKVHYPTDDTYYRGVSNLFYTDTEGQDYSMNQVFSQIKNTDMTFALPKNLTHTSGLVSEIVYGDWYEYNSLVAFCAFGGSLVLMLLIICMPIRQLDDMVPFRGFRKLKGEINILLMGFGAPLLVMALMVFVSYTLCQRYDASWMGLLSEFGIHISQGLLYQINWIVWFLFFVVASIFFYIIKYILVDGIWRFIKEDTYIGVGCRKVNHYCQALLQVDYSEKGNSNIVKFVVIQMILMLGMCLLSFVGIGFILVIAYSVWLVYYLSKNYQQYKKDYDQLLSVTKQLSYEQFDDIQQMDFGTFASMKDALQQLGQGYKHALNEEIKSQKLKTELISNVSHDLKTPLTGICNYLELLDDENLTHEQRQDYMDTLKRYITRFKALMEDLFEVSKVNSGDVSLELAKLDICALINQTKAECEELLASKELQVVMNSEKEHIYCLLDGNKTYRIFENLFNNIGKYSLAHTRVFIDLKLKDNKVEISFKNISEAPLDFDTALLSERFVRGDKSRHTEGSGLGLAIVQSFTEIQNGSFKIDTDGDLFKIILNFETVEPNSVDENQIIE